MDVKRSQCSCWYNLLLEYSLALDYSLCTYNSRYLVAPEKILRDQTHQTESYFFLLWIVIFNDQGLPLWTWRNSSAWCIRTDTTKQDKRKEQKNHWKKKKTRRWSWGRLLVLRFNTMVENSEEALCHYIEILSCSDLLIRDRKAKSSDPYVKVKLAGKDIHTTKTILKWWEGGFVFSLCLLLFVRLLRAADQLDPFAQSQSCFYRCAQQCVSFGLFRKRAFW